MDNFVEGVWATYRSTREEEALIAAVGAGNAAGAEATAWRRPLPDEAYGPQAVEALRAADAAAADPAKP